MLSTRKVKKDSCIELCFVELCCRWMKSNITSKRQTSKEKLQLYWKVRIGRNSVKRKKIFSELNCFFFEN